MMKSKKDTQQLLPMASLAEAAECLRTLAHPARLRMVQLLLQGDHTVGELAEACDLPSHMASEHLGLMRDRGLLQSERQGRYIYYRIAEEGLAGIMQCLQHRFGGKT
jgi:DNA-binding transcriptional ArsR family regulator